MSSSDSDNEGSDTPIIDKFIRDGARISSKKKVTPKKKYCNSAFSLTINPNISYKTLTTSEDRSKAVKSMEIFIKDIIYKNLQNKFLLKRFSNQPICDKPVDKFKYSIEIGKQKGFLHCQMRIKLSCCAHLDQQKIRILAAQLNHGKAPHVSIRYVHDYQKALDNYLEKDGYYGEINA